MTEMKRILIFMTLLLSVLSPILTQAQMSDEDKAIAIASAHGEFADFLSQYEGWEAWAYFEDGVWIVEFGREANGEEKWLGYAVLSIDTGEVYEAFAPKPLPTDVHTELQTKVLTLVENDAEMLARVGDISQWETWVEYDVYEQVWFVAFFKGLDAWAAVVQVEFAEDSYDVLNISIADIVDPHRFEEQDAREYERNDAIALAYEADGIDEALSGHDDWDTLVSEQDDGVWAVQFVIENAELFYALVDVNQRQILETN